ncbi:hypothetical protein U4E84_05335 [Halorubrum sp. AD140]|uniref:hypothetical protein n=1 Tax=Halorubrum sp. AD140 TaxID=3050073 RepID=UPI002ACCA2A8|nr:hypothetical protein [Halorubrum sp. AD140]MDZ5810770.1 hypothetical protein [Halorubrum sp. AD140]
MALLKPFREAARLRRKQPILSVPIPILAVLQARQLCFAALDPVLSLGGIAEERFQSDATTAACRSNGLDNPHLSH